MLHCGICVKSLNGRSTKWNFWGTPISQLAPSRSIWTCLQPKECYILVNVKLFRSSSGHWAPTDNNPPSSRKQPSWTRWLPACWQHNIRLYKHKWKSDQHSYMCSLFQPHPAFFTIERLAVCWRLHTTNRKMTIIRSERVGKNRRSHISWCLTMDLKRCQSPKFMFISFLSSSRLHWDRTRPFTLAYI